MSRFTANIANIDNIVVVVVVVNVIVVTFLLLSLLEIEEELLPKLKLLFKLEILVRLL